jgi:hypothetical protein
MTANALDKTAAVPAELEWMLALNTQQVGFEV